ncbi:MAG: hypothetical protein LBV06_00550 [Propionibacteriaceae bacterium]|jgi:hypothetical protein|nr:hypothetical protein [Propionibacteriaceae bacterium]
MTHWWIIPTPAYDNDAIVAMIDEYFPNRNPREIRRLAERMNATGCVHIGDINSLFSYFDGRPDEFEDKFGYLLYRPDGTLNYDLMFADFWCYTQRQNPGVPETSMPLAQYAEHCAGITLNYLFIRNPLYIERLTLEHITTFLKHANDPTYTTNPDLNQIVTDTWPTITKFSTSATKSPPATTEAANGSATTPSTSLSTAPTLTTNSTTRETPPASIKERLQYVEVTVADAVRESLKRHRPGHTYLFVNTT